MGKRGALSKNELKIEKCLVFGQISQESVEVRGVEVLKFLTPNPVFGPCRAYLSMGRPGQLR